MRRSLDPRKIRTVAALEKPRSFGLRSSRFVESTRRRTTGAKMPKTTTALAALFLMVTVGSVQANQAGMASFYGTKFQGRKTASGERYSNAAMTAAHRTAPFGTRMKVTNVSNGRSVVVRVNDRGPFVRGRVIDVSRAAATQLGFVGRGVTRVRVERL
jgi:rare lipoprotein A